jgi:hypothetical protein
MSPDGHFLGESARNLMRSGFDKGQEVVERILNHLEEKKTTWKLKVM